MDLDTIDRGLNRELRILEQQLAAGDITQAAYNAAVRELYREAREQARDLARQEREERR